MWRFPQGATSAFPDFFDRAGDVAVERLRRLIDEVVETGPVPPRVGRDLFLAVACALAVVVEIALEPTLRWERLAVGIATAVLVPNRRQTPLVSLGAALALHVVFEVLARRAGHSGEATIGQIGAGMLLVYALCRWGRPDRVAIGTALLISVFVGAELVIETEPRDFGFLVSWLLLVVVALAMRYRWVMVDQRDRRIRIAERHALARDVHDSVAHHVSAIAVQAQAARYVSRTDPEAAASAMARIETAAGHTVDELRRLVGVLRADDPGVGSTPPESLLDLVDPDGHPPVAIRGIHDLTTVPASVATGVYRIAQEAVTNARRHSRQATVVEVLLRRTDDERLVLEVVDDGAVTGPPGTGYGLTGMRERAVVLGGTVTCGPLPTAGWRVRAVLPLR